ncbi:fucose-1-phosphate guanylyltransferase isoform X2 [Antennarius striatus]|uniref:fucose-1-phosphate guanylyltransferase isoform X2 n=1 Tax=Antennarius striatus TaxID=241820 RepID=UPI0035B13EE7
MLCLQGNGGSTLYALQRLQDIYGKAFSTLRVIIIHAGGWSQRLPSASALGKIFTALPLGDPLYQMLELKLAMYVEFPSQMKPGVLVTCADDIELYSTAENESIRFDKPGFTALAHPSPLLIGTTHGVFVLDPFEMSTNSDMATLPCMQFLHKPSISKMRDSGAVFKSPSGCFPLSDAEFVYTDSTYYVDFETVKSLLNVLKHLGPLDCEIDAYGDFLQALGSAATIDYTNNTSNVTKEERNLVEIRQKIFNLLKGTPLNVVVLNNSKFYHLGTTSEYLFHFTEDPVLRNELGLLSFAFSVQKNENSESSLGCCVMYSIFDPDCTVESGSVVEYSRLGAGVSVGRSSIISGCWVGPGLSVPDAVFMHSLCVNHKQQTRFVTVMFGINDNLKRTVESPASMNDLSYFGFSLTDCLTRWGLKKEDLRFSSSASSCCLWKACLFPVCTEPQSSFLMSLQMLWAIMNKSTFTLPKDTPLISMEESLQCKNLEEMLKFRKGLYNEIKQKHLN